MRFSSIRAVRREQAEEWFWRLVFPGSCLRLSISGLACHKISAPLGAKFPRFLAKPTD
jgi:hypothetical protein